ncbi:MAG: hypothetical protein JO212_15565, partial [Acetobacteraceae bacterium]|nr:hypothetical protein [Acetobacteraceae bacterium]
MNNRRAIVIGGSVAGLLAARVLSDIFREVVIFERDHFPDGPVHRKGVPQSRHVHVLLARGLEVLEELFPGLSEELIELGAPVSKPEQLLYWIGGGYFCNSAYPHRSITCSRPLLERVIRSRVLTCPTVRAADGTPVVAIATSGDSARVSGVRLATGQSGVLGDLVVDATGRGSHASAWIQAMGYPTPREERVKAGMGYSSRHYRREPDQLGGKHFLALGATPACRRGAVVSAQEGDRWIVTLAGYAGDHPPTDHSGFVAFAATLGAPDVHELISP